MRILPVCGLLMALAAVPAVAQSGPNPSSATNTAAATATAPAPNADYAALREKLASRNKELSDAVSAQRAMVKHNEELLKEAQRLDAANRKLEVERQQLATQNANLQKQREALTNGQTASNTPGGK